MRRARFALLLMAVSPAGCDGSFVDAIDGTSSDAGSSDVAAPDGGALDVPDTAYVADTSMAMDATDSLDSDVAPMDGGVPFDGGDVGPPVPGPIGWLLDGETGAFQGEEMHDGVQRHGCNRHPEFAEVLSGSPAYGERVVRVMLDGSWPWGESNCRSSGRPFTLLRSIDSMRTAEGEDVWVGMAVQVPETWELPANSYYIQDFHPSTGGPRSWLTITEELGFAYISRVPGSFERVELGDVQLGRWHEFVIHARLTSADTGLLEIWTRLRGEPEWEQVMDFTGPTVPSDATFRHRVEFTIDQGASGGWDDPSDNRFLYLDEMRVGGPDATFDMVSPGSRYVPER